jgi:hypothetical protein
MAIFPHSYQWPFILINVLLLLGINETSLLNTELETNFDATPRKKKLINTYNLPKTVWEELNNEGRKNGTYHCWKSKRDYLFHWVIKTEHKPILNKIEDYYYTKHIETYTTPAA